LLQIEVKQRHFDHNGAGRRAGPVPVLRAAAENGTAARWPRG
jgi:hypothetical protein